MNPLHALLPLADILLPRVCHICGCRLHGDERYLCTPCLSALPRTNYHRRPDNPMEQRFAGRFPFLHAAGFLFYSPESDVARIMIDMKYHSFRGLARYMGAIMGRELYSTGFFHDTEILIPVPMHFMKQARRGYNQAEQLALGISETTGIPLFNGLKAIRPHRTQTSLSHRRRFQNTQGIFRLPHPEGIEDKRVLLIDDVCTTGATLSAAAEAILEAAPGVRLSLLSLGVTF